MLTLRPTGLSSPAYRDWLDYIVLEDGRAIGRMYEDRHAKPELRWFWSITDYIKPEPGLLAWRTQHCKAEGFHIEMGN